MYTSKPNLNMLFTSYGKMRGNRLRPTYVNILGCHLQFSGLAVYFLKILTLFSQFNLAALFACKQSGVNLYLKYNDL